MRPLLCLLFALTASAADRPNIVVILADDFGYGSAGCYGADPKLIRTPAIDRLAAEGRRFTDGNTTSSVCSPTRYSLLTGRYCWRTSLTHEVLGTFSPLHIEPGRVNVASLLKAKGYATAAVGKWHLGYGKENEDPKWRTEYKAELSPGPLDIGFDYHFGVPSNHGDLTGVYVEDRFVYGLRSGGIPSGTKLAGPATDSDDFKATYGPEDMENGKAKILDLDAPRRKNERVMKVLTDKATTWLEAQPKDRPFFLYFTPVAVHNPVTPDKALAGSSAAGPYGDWIHELDASVGRILATLDKMGATKDTLVLFTSDNGGVFKPENERLLQTAAFKAGLKVNGGIRGGKHDVWEGGFKVPFIARWPGKVPAGSTATQMVSVVDILATTAEIVGAPLPAKEVGAEDSRSFLPALIPGAAEAKGREDLIIHSADGVFAVRKGRWKWIEGVPVDEIAEGARKARKAQHRPQLYDTIADPAETKDVSAEHPEVVAELKDLLRRYRDGGFSRELPAADVKPLRPGIATLSDLTGKAEALSPLASAGEWNAREGGLFAQPKGGQEKPASLRSPLTLGDGVFDCEVNLQGANRVSLRFGAGDAGFRLVISRTNAILTKNPSKGEPSTATEDLAKKNLKLAAGEWYPVRLTFKGDEVTIQVNDQTFKGRHPSIGKAKTSVDLLVFGASAGFRQVRVAR
ncbi:MAG: sulfatase family protein [Opitutales bacterium]|jgi:arylsulfatase A-like enzyme